MIEIEKPRIEVESLSEDESYGKFIVEPLERGYGTTLGNSLRRVLLSSLPVSYTHLDVYKRQPYQRYRSDAQTECVSV